jgi:uncharacterized GH25 family protein
VKEAAIVLLLCLGLGSVAPAQEGGTGTLAGTVVNEKGKPVAGATVTMEESNGGNPHATTTNRSGRFFFPQLIHGYYDVRAAHSGTSSNWKHNIEVTTGRQTEVTLRLARTLEKP